MKTIFYGMCGEGLGHCARALALIEYMEDVDFHIFTYGDAYSYLNSIGVANVHLIQGLEFVEKKGHVQIIPTVKDAFKFLMKGMRQNKNLLFDMAKQYKPDLFLTDWEPSIPRIAAKLKIPCLSIDSQHKFRFSKLDGFPLFLKLYGFTAALVCRAMIPKVDRYILSTYQTDLIERRSGVTLAQCLIRKQIADIDPVDEGHLLLYVRQEELARKMITCLLEQNPQRQVICYGVRLDEEFPEVIFKPRDYINFSKDLATCHAVFSTAGIQLIGEARYFGKPSFVIPIPGQYEQYVNAFYVDRLKLGFSSTYQEISPDKVSEFLNTFKEGIPVSENGIEAVTEIITYYLEKESDAA